MKAKRPMNADDRRALAEKTLRLGVDIVKEERDIVRSSYAERDGQVRDAGALREIRRYDRFLRGARKVLA